MRKSKLQLTQSSHSILKMVGAFLVLVSIIFALQSTQAQAQVNVGVSNMSLFAAQGDPCEPTAGKDSLPTAVFVPWYEYLDGQQNADGSCSPVLPRSANGNIIIQSSITRILIAVTELLMRLSALVAVGYMLWGIFQFIGSQGEPNNLASAKSTIANSIIGLIIVLLAIGIVQFIGNSLR